MKKLLFLAALTILFTYCEKEDDDNDMNKTSPSYSPSYIASD
jgi:hypothetical protein